MTSQPATPHATLNPLKSRRIVLGVTGGIAAYKAAWLCRLLIKAGAEVQVVMTPAACKFVTPLSFQALSGKPVRVDGFDREAEAAMGHIELARWAELIVIAPASANTLAKLAHGIADNLLTTLCLASRAPLAVAPAMNRQMWANSATQANMTLITTRNVQIWGPDAGEQACGDTGEGRMQEPEQLLQQIVACIHKRNDDPNLPLAGKSLLISAGPTRETIDPVRFLGNRSSGKTGYAIAAAAQRAGAQVTLVSGPTQLATPDHCQRIDVESALQMQQAVQGRINDCDGFISVAAVADWRSANQAEQKLKKQADSMTLQLIRNPDILAEVANGPQRPRLCIGFAAETEHLERHARQKLLDKNLDLIIANRVANGAVFGSDDSEWLVLSRDPQQAAPGSTSPPTTLGPANKEQLAAQLIPLIAARLC